MRDTEQLTKMNKDKMSLEAKLLINQKRSWTNVLINKESFPDNTAIIL